MATDSPRGSRSAGFSLAEILVAVTAGAFLVASGGALFLGQLRNYQDLRTQSEMQSEAKKAAQELLREISNTGALFRDPANTRPGFAIASDNLSVAYLDLRQRYCASAADTAKIRLFVRSGAKGDTLVKEVRCNSLVPVPRPILANPGRISLNFRYFRLDGSETAAERTAVQRVRFTLDIKSPKGKSLFDKSRVPTIDVDLANY